MEEVQITPLNSFASPNFNLKLQNQVADPLNYLNWIREPLKPIAGWF